jgi:predicted tellurium resistance membrane protein TerC
MELLLEPQVWLSFFTLAALEIVLGIDNIIFLSVLVGRLAAAQRRTARLAGLGFAMLTRLALLYSVVWLIGLRRPLLQVLGAAFSGRDLILLFGGGFLIANSVIELREMLPDRARAPEPGASRSVALTILQIGLIDIVFSLDSVFTAVGLARRVEVMAAAIVCSVLFMMWVSGAVSEFIERHPRIKVLALAFLLVVGAALIAESLHRPVPPSYLYFAMAFSTAVELINMRLRRSSQRLPADDG